VSSSPQRLGLALCLALLGCERGTAPAALNLAAASSAPIEPEPKDAGAWASRVHAVEPAPAAAARAKVEATLNAVREAVMEDDVEDSDEPVLAGRYVYRVSFAVPPSFRDHRAVVEAPAGELHLDVSHARLHARFLGPGFPVAEGSEVRLRADLPGVYLFDEQGGRSLGAGQLAAWFEGIGSDKDTQTRVGVWRETGKRATGPLPTDLICALLAEWAHQDRELLVHRCEGGALPPLFRVGPWTGELTAVVPMQLPRHALRADEHGAPQLPATVPRVQLLEPSAVARLQPSRAEPAVAPGALVVHNHTAARALVFAQGVAVSWVDAGKDVRIDGFAPGYYRMGAVRPLGVLRMPPKLVRVPGELHLGSVQLLAASSTAAKNRAR